MKYIRQVQNAKPSSFLKERSKEFYRKLRFREKNYEFLLQKRSFCMKVLSTFLKVVSVSKAHGFNLSILHLAKIYYRFIEEKYIIENNKAIMEKAMGKYVNLKNDLFWIKSVYAQLQEEMDKKMQSV